MKVGVISYTHGLLRPEALKALLCVDLIIHAGDIGAAEVLTALAEIAPVTAVRGNNDRGQWAESLPETAVVEAEGTRLYVLHDLHALDRDPRDAGLAAVIAGHSHKPGKQHRDGVLFFNPGSAGPRRFKLPVALGMLTIVNGRVTGKIIQLED